MVEFVVNLVLGLLDLMLWVGWAKEHESQRDNLPNRVLRFIMSFVVLLTIVGCFALFILMLVNMVSGRR